MAAKKIAIVDDRPGMVAGMEFLLKELGCEVLPLAIKARPDSEYQGLAYATDLTVVVAKLQNFKPDLVLLDWDLGDDADFTGEDLARHANLPRDKCIGTGSVGGQHVYCAHRLDVRKANIDMFMSSNDPREFQKSGAAFKEQITELIGTT